MEYESSRQTAPFDKILEKYSGSVPENWKDELKNYIIHGFEPGSFHRNLYSNNLAGATTTSDSFNEWNWIQLFMDFLLQHAPVTCWGSKEKVERWLKMDKGVRYMVCQQYDLLLTPAEATWNILETSE